MSEVRICDGHERAGVRRQLDPKERNARAYIGEMEFDLCPECIPFYKQFKSERDELVADLQERIQKQERLIEERFWQRVKDNAERADDSEIIQAGHG